MTARPYQRAHHRESDESDDDDEDNSSDCRQQRVSRSQRAAQRSMQLHAFLWMAAAGLVAYGTDFIRVIATDARVKWGFFEIALGCTGVNVCITAYLAVYLPCIKRIQLDWSVYCPKVISVGTVAGSVAALSYVCAFWPVYGLFTPGLLGLLSIGTLMIAHFVPPI
ncbi:unnamed protein product [Hyaloperonospora brassicae]|uniref:Transmembrane protein n=1 Tax=Hyaloperonospora brassicae TaxID=162125 RepID=A0AAV0V6C0_HYABA|nr:unnamed protein product [Hyaloperonospora brassicae]